MRGKRNPQSTMLAFVNLDERVPPDHPLRTIKQVADDVLSRMSDDFDGMYSRVGRASVPPERLLKSLLLISLYSIRSERAFCQELDYNLLYRWFLDMDLMEPSFRCDHVHQEQKETSQTQGGKDTVRGGGIRGGQTRADVRRALQCGRYADRGRGIHQELQKKER